MDINRIFILGLGHQKCGTSWFHKYLCQSEYFATGPAKEFHVWDRRDISLFKEKRLKLNLRTLLSRSRYVRYQMENSEDFYFSYFDNLMKRNKTITADITPSYSGLNSERLDYIKQKFLARGIETKAVIFVREPLARIKSAVRFNLDRGNYSEGIAENESDFEKALIQYYRTEHCSMRTMYENIISNAGNVFSPENIYVGFYENMFDASSVIELSEFLKIDAKVEFANVRVNKTKNVVPVTESDQEVREFYAETYDFFYEKYPICNELWK